MTDPDKELYLPALRGIMGDWVYYSCLMDIKTVSERVQYAKELHQHDGLSTMIQRQLDKRRGKEIAAYIKDQPQRLFNSLVVATYGGNPNWISLASVQDHATSANIQKITPETISSLGFLVLQGDEKLFAVDGQHRLAGIKRVIKEGVEQNPYDEVSVIMIAHKHDAAGLERSRRLFTTLNKTTRAVSKGDIIALDEDDVMAICVRRLVANNELFSGDRLAIVASNNMPVRNETSLTTIGNLYDVLGILFTKSQWPLKRPKATLRRLRPPDHEIDQYFNYSVSFFDTLRANFSEIDEFASSTSERDVVKRFRGEHGGKVVFRPLGLELYATVVSQLSFDMGINAAIETVARLPRNLHEPPFEKVLWDSRRASIVGGNKVLLRELLLYMLNRNSEKFPETDLLERYQRVTGISKIRLPSKVL